MEIPGSNIIHNIFTIFEVQIFKIPEMKKSEEAGMGRKAGWSL